MKTTLLFKFLPFLCLVAMVPLRASQPVELPAVGPSTEHEGVMCGYLEVYTPTQEHQWGEGSTYYPHTGYRLLTKDGKELKWVSNHQTDIDEDPEKVELAPGNYFITAQSDKYGMVRVPVIIKLAQTTVVRLGK